MAVKSRYIVPMIVVILILICGIGIIHFMKRKKPINIIESKLKIKLTSPSSIVNFMQSDTYGAFL